MNEQSLTQIQTIKKLHVKNTVEFAINNIPGVDEGTLEKFLELVNARGNFGEINEGEVIEKMNLIMKYIPGACARSLLTVVELLDIRFPRPVALHTTNQMIAPTEDPRLLSVVMH
jgi:hypothetical protein